MSLPAELAQIPVARRTYVYRDGTPVAGKKITLELATEISVGLSTIVPKKLTIELDENGQVPAGITLPSTNDPDASITGLAYTVKEHWKDGRSGQLVVPYDAPEIDLADLVPDAPDPEYTAAIGAAVSAAAAEEAQAAAEAAKASAESAASEAATSAQAASDSADAAAASAIAASDSADAAAASASASAASATTAEGWADAAQASGRIYASTAAGLAATVDGEYFSVPSADADEYLILYKNDAGSATEIKRYASATAVSGIRDTLGLSTTLGSELIVNGDFASSTGWTAGGGWSISGGVASAASGGSLSRNITLESGAKYMVAFDMISRTAGNVQPQFSVGSTDGSEMFDTAGKRRTIIVSGAAGLRTFSMKSNSGVLSIDNVSVKKLLRGGYLYAMGDSLTYWQQFGLVKDNYYPYLLESYMPHIKSINLGVSGNSTAQMVARLSSVTNAPYIFVMYGGTNDPSADTTVQASPAPTTTTFSVGAGQGVRYGVGAKILVNGVQAEIQSISTDAITLTSALGFTPTAGQSVKIDTTANLVKMGQYVQAMGCSRILVVGRHFDNWASGTGDSTSAESATNAKVRAWSRRAAAALGAVYVDTYAFMRDLILTGAYAAGDDAAWNAATTNIHLNATGQAIIAEAMYDAMLKAGW